MSAKLAIGFVSTAAVCVAGLAIFLVNASQVNSRLNRDFGANKVKLEQLQGELEEKSKTIATLSSERDQLVTQRDELVEQNGELVALNAEMEIELTRLSVSRRRALVRDVTRDAGFTQFELVEIDQANEPVGPPIHHRIEGDILKIDWYEVRWRSTVARSDPDRSFPIFLLRGLYGDKESPAQARQSLDPNTPEVTLDARGVPPEVYNRDGRISAREAIIWERFWDVSHDPEIAEGFGIESASLNSVGQQIRPGYEYEWVITGGGSSHVISRPVHSDAEPAS